MKQHRINAHAIPFNTLFVILLFSSFTIESSHSDSTNSFYGLTNSILIPLETTEIFTTIPFNNRVGTLQALSTVLNLSELEQLSENGCWCSGLRSGRSDSAYIGSLKDLESDTWSQESFENKNPGHPKNALDDLCRRWFHDRRCLNLQNGVCQDSESKEYTLKLVRNIENGDFEVDESHCSESGKSSCESTKCLLDVFYANSIAEKFHENVFVDSSDCFLADKNAPSEGFFSECHGVFNFTEGISEFEIIHQELECGCRNGTAAVGEDCPVNAAEFCMECEMGFSLVDITESNDTLTMPHCIQASCLDESASDDCFQVFWSTEEFFCPFSDTESCESIKVLEKRENHFGIPDCLMFLSWSNLQGSPELSYSVLTCWCVRNNVFCGVR